MTTAIQDEWLVERAPNRWPKHYGGCRPAASEDMKSAVAGLAKIVAGAQRMMQTILTGASVIKDLALGIA